MASRPLQRQQLYRRLKPLEIEQCPFANLPEAKSGRWGTGLTAANMKKCQWVKPLLVGQFEFTEWTPDNHLRHSSFITLRDDKDAKTVVQESSRFTVRLIVNRALDTSTTQPSNGCAHARPRCRSKDVKETIDTPVLFAERSQREIGV